MSIPWSNFLTTDSPAESSELICSFLILLQSDWTIRHTHTTSHCLWFQTRRVLMSRTSGQMFLDDRKELTDQWRWIFGVLHWSSWPSSVSLLIVSCLYIYFLHCKTRQSKNKIEKRGHTQANLNIHSLKNRQEKELKRQIKQSKKRLNSKNNVTVQRESSLLTL